LSKVVKFQERKMKKKYKRKEYTCKKYLLEFPVKANPKIELHKGKNFDDVEITSKDTPEKEIVNIQLTRIKHPNEANRPPQ
jgi:hypothetical protein